MFLYSLDCIYLFYSKLVFWIVYYFVKFFFIENLVVLQKGYDQLLRLMRYILKFEIFFIDQKLYLNIYDYRK